MKNYLPTILATLVLISIPQSAFAQHPPGMGYMFPPGGQAGQTMMGMVAATPADAGMLEFDLGSLSLDLGGDTEQPVIAEAPATTEDPLATKLALAEEFSAIGDADGARALIEEVIEEASGEMKAKAQRALSNL